MTVSLGDDVVKCSQATLFLLITIAGGCEDPSQPQTPVATTQQESQSPAQQTSSISEHDVAIIAQLPTWSSKWNRAAAPLVRDYLDPTVSSDRWVREARFHVADLRAAYTGMYTDVLTFEDPGIRGVFQHFVANYKSKLDAVTALHIAVARGTQLDIQRAEQNLRSASAEGQRLAEALLDRLRPYVDPEELAEELRKKGKDIAELMQPQ